MIKRSDYMGWKRKDYKENQKAHNGNYGNDNVNDSEFLRIQGLIRCFDCENPYPFEHTRCPHCDSPNKERMN